VSAFAPSSAAMKGARASRESTHVEERARHANHRPTRSLPPSRAMRREIVPRAVFVFNDGPGPTRASILGFRRGDERRRACALGARRADLRRPRAARGAFSRHRDITSPCARSANSRAPIAAERDELSQVSGRGGRRALALYQAAGCPARTPSAWPIGIVAPPVRARRAVREELGLDRGRWLARLGGARRSRRSSRSPRAARPPRPLPGRSSTSTRARAPPSSVALTVGGAVRRGRGHDRSPGSRSRPGGVLMLLIGAAPRRARSSWSRARRRPSVSRRPGPAGALGRGRSREEPVAGLWRPRVTVWPLCRTGSYEAAGRGRPSWRRSASGVECPSADEHDLRASRAILPCAQAQAVRAPARSRKGRAPRLAREAHESPSRARRGAEAGDDLLSGSGPSQRLVFGERPLRELAVRVGRCAMARDGRAPARVAISHGTGPPAPSSVSGKLARSAAGFRSASARGTPARLLVRPRSSFVRRCEIAASTARAPPRGARAWAAPASCFDDEMTPAGRLAPALPASASSP